jgi:hypothetical protein
VLHDIVEGKSFVVKTVNTKDGMQDIQVKPDFKEILKAIEIDNIMAGDNTGVDVTELAKHVPRIAWVNGSE